MLLWLVLALFGCERSALEQQTLEQQNDQQKLAAVNNQTLDKILSSQTIVIGYRDMPAPFSYLSKADNQPIGYSIDIANHIVNGIKKATNNPNLKVVYRPVTSSERISAVQRGDVDFECSTTTNTLDRQRKVAFSVGFFVVTPRFLANKNSQFQGYKDLHNQTIAVIENSSSEYSLLNYIAINQLAVKTLRMTNSYELENALNTGKANLVFSDDVLLASNRLNLKNRDDWEITGEPKTYEIYACSLPKNDVNFKRLVDNSLLDLYSTGGIYRLYDKWFKNPMPELNVNLNHALSLQNAELFAKPNDAPSLDNITQATQDISKAFGMAN
ncbi:amino acid ABC transporter substrate-binding protein [Moraxella macacae]|nr:amino acid ABC transporter substrate-binding protein [Moraxella macacae]